MRRLPALGEVGAVGVNRFAARRSGATPSSGAGAGRGSPIARDEARLSAGSEALASVSVRRSINEGTPLDAFEEGRADEAPGSVCEAGDTPPGWGVSLGIEAGEAGAGRIMIRTSARA